MAASNSASAFETLQDEALSYSEVFTTWSGNVESIVDVISQLEPHFKRNSLKGHSPDALCKLALVIQMHLKAGTLSASNDMHKENKLTSESAEPARNEGGPRQSSPNKRKRDQNNNVEVPQESARKDSRATHLWPLNTGRERSQAEKSRYNIRPRNPTYLYGQLQYYALDAIIHLAEDGLFYFSEKWTKSRLEVRGRMHLKSIELAKFFETLMHEKVPAEAIRIINGEGPAFEIILPRLTQIRNSGVHRDNNIAVEILILKAKDCENLLKDILDTYRAALVRDIRVELTSILHCLEESAEKDVAEATEKLAKVMKELREVRRDVYDLRIECEEMGWNLIETHKRNHFDENDRANRLLESKKKEKKARQSEGDRLEAEESRLMNIITTRGRIHEDIDPQATEKLHTAVRRGFEAAHSFIYGEVERTCSSI